MRQHHLKYRPDIDGLRAVAILLVIDYHGFPNIFKGGFIGVDVFFIISGFLISSIIFDGLEQSQFSFLFFYGQRIRRIFPTLVCVLVFSAALGWFCLFPNEFALLGRHIAAGTVFASNILLWKEAGYFDTISESKPLLHLWSLGIEEQFYILWPVLVFFAFRRKHILALLIGTFLLGSFAYNIFITGTDHVAAFYSPFVRFWELMMGSALAYWRREDAWPIRVQSMQQKVIILLKLPKKDSVYHEIYAWIGFLLLVISVLVITKNGLFPGWLALLPTGGTLLLIAAGPKSSINRIILASPPMVWIGKISYPLYLWHWPLLSYLSILKPHHGNSIVFLLLAASILLAWFSYLYAERPIRFAKHDMKLKTAGVFLILMLLGLGGEFLMNNGILKPRLASDFFQGFDHGTEFIGFDQKLAGAAEIHSKKGSTGKTTLIFGDSNAAQYAQRIRILLDNKNIRTNNAEFAIGWGCPPIPGVIDTINHPQCINLVQDVQQYVDEHPEIDTVAVAAEWVSYFWAPTHTSFFYAKDNKPENKLDYLGPELPSSAMAFDALQKMLSEFRAQGKRTFLVFNIPVGGEFNPRLLLKTRLHPEPLKYNTVPENKDKFMYKYEHVLPGLLSAAHNSGATIIDPMQNLCDETNCLTFDQGIPIYYDDEHLKIDFIKEKASYIDQVVLPVDAEEILP